MSLLLLGGTQIVKAQALSGAERAKLEAELVQIEKDKAEATNVLNVTKTQTSSIQKDVNVLTGEIKKTQLNIKAKDINIKQIGGGYH